MMTVEERPKGKSGRKLTEVYSLLETVVNDLSKPNDMFVVTFLHDSDLTANGLFGGAEHRTRCVARSIWESLVMFLDAIDSLDGLTDIYRIGRLVLRTKQGGGRKEERERR